MIPLPSLINSLLLLLLLPFLLLVVWRQTNVAAVDAKLSKRQSGVGCLLGMVPPIGGTIQYSNSLHPELSNNVGTYPEGTTATLICQQGVPLGQSVSVCENGMWQPALFPGCSNMGVAGGVAGGISGGQCLLGIAPVLNGNLVYSNSVSGNQQTGPYPHGTTVRLQCLNGMLPTGTRVATCLNGQWQPALLGMCS